MAKKIQIERQTFGPEPDYIGRLVSLRVPEIADDIPIDNNCNECGYDLHRLLTNAFGSLGATYNLGDEVKSRFGETVDGVYGSNVTCRNCHEPYTGSLVVEEGKLTAIVLNGRN
jgi:hypothetical protein